MLWNRNFTSLAAANVFFHAAVYMQFPLLHRWMTEVWGYTGVEAACMAVVFGLSLFVPGVFNSYLVDTFSRKRVCVWSMIVLGLANPCFAYLAGRSVRDCFDVDGQYVGYRRGFQSSAGQGEPGFYLVGHCGDVSGYPYRFDECAASRL